jgi:anti-anti-sigma factor
LLASPIGAQTSQRGCLSAKTEASRATENAKKVLSVAGTRVLTTATACKFRERVIAGLNGHDVIEVDLSGTTFMDCGGLGALIALRNATRDRKGRVRLLNPTPPVEQVLRLLEAQRVFEIVTARPSC